jgi:3-hydroxyisobutyrate dehydrogenase-like beta-hydroxyacid dehydrogenase
MSDKPRVGFIGLGLMGLPMSRNILKAGFSLTVHNRSRGKVDQLVAEGATPAASAAELAASCDVILSCLPLPKDVASVYLGEGGVVAAAKPGAVLCDMSTIDAATHRAIAEAAAARGLGYLDAPVSGGPSGARDATLAIMVGGEAAAFERAKPVFDAMGTNVYHVGPVGSGATVKLINQMMGAICGLGVVEGLVMAAKAGVDARLLVDIVTNSSGGSRSLGGMAPNILERNFEPGFTLDYQSKDVSLAVALAKELGVRTLAGALAEQVIGEARALGLGSRATYALVQPLERVTGVEVRG